MVAPRWLPSSRYSRQLKSQGPLEQGEALASRVTVLPAWTTVKLGVEGMPGPAMIGSAGIGTTGEGWDGVTGRTTRPCAAFVAFGITVTACPPRACGAIAHANAAQSIRAAPASRTANAGVRRFIGGVYGAAVGGARARA